MQDKNKKFNQIYEEISRHKSRNIEKNYNSTCLLCGNKAVSLCKSHSIPKNKLLTNSSLLSVGFFLNDKTAIQFPRKKSSSKKTGIFKNICRDCDGFKFQSYENNKFINSFEQINEIHLKSELFFNYLKIQHFSLAQSQKDLFYDDLCVRGKKVLDDSLRIYEEDKKMSFEKINSIKNNNYSKQNEFSYISEFGFYCNTLCVPYRDIKNKKLNDTFIFDDDRRFDTEFLIYAYYDEKLKIQHIHTWLINPNKRDNIKFSEDKVGASKLISFLLLYTPIIYFTENSVKYINKEVLNELYTCYNQAESISTFNSSTRIVKKLVELGHYKSYQKALKIYRKNSENLFINGEEIDGTG